MAHSKSCYTALMPTVALALVLIALAPSGGEASSRGVFNQMNKVETLGYAEEPKLCRDLIVKHGFKCEEIEVTTKDGYILNLQKIHARRDDFGSPVRITQKPVLLQHGVLVDAAIWLLNTDPTKDLPLILANKGHDVWLANTRGTRFSRRHTSLTGKDVKYWEWSFDELVAYDLPAVIDHISNSSNGQKVNFIGHSLGTLMALASLSEGGSMIDKLNSVTLLSPVAYVTYLKSPIAAIAARMFAGELIRSIGWAEFNPNSVPVSLLVDHLCNTAGIKCYDLLAVLTGKNCCLNASTISTFMYHEPQPTSTKTLVHLSQAVRNGGIAKFDYGLHNMARYGSSAPPEYDLSKIPTNIPMYISYGGKDLLSDVVDVEKILSNLKNHDKGKLKVNFLKDYAHADFVMATNAKELLYDSVTNFFYSQEL